MGSLGGGETAGRCVEDDVCKSAVPRKFGGTLQAAGSVEREAQSGIGRGAAQGVRADEPGSARKQGARGEQLAAELNELACGSLRSREQRTSVLSEWSSKNSIFY